MAKNEKVSEGKPIVEGEKEEEIPSAEVMQGLPPELAKNGIGFGLSMSSYSGPVPPQLLEKITESHISKILEISEKEAERHFEDTRSSRRYTFGYVLVFVSLLVFLTVFLVFKDVELYKEVFKLLIVYLGGLGSGIGINQWVGRKS